MPSVMPRPRSSSASSLSSNVESPDHISAPSSADSIDTDEYPSVPLPGYDELPLEEGLEPIAVVGMGCRLPGDVKSASDFWDLMMSKSTGNTPKVPSSRFNIDSHIHANNDRPGSFGVLGGYFLHDDLADFDPGLFSITPVEAMWMDPQQRKLLEVVYECLESGGISLDKIAGTNTAVFAASFTADWQQMAFKENSFRHSLAATGVDPGIISNRISHVFNLTGPSILCNTACSSSVYALHNACNALRNNETEAAIVGGVNLIITVDQHMNTAKLGVLSPTSTCHTFDESADGYGRADAVGALYLKRLSDAIRDGDPIRGVIRSSATNQNGKVPGNGITHPNRDGQATVIAAAYKRGGHLNPRLTGYFEIHGTGTKVGDPLEAHAVSMAMNQERRPDVDRPLWIGAVKTNIGHSEAASGISAVIKAILISERGVIPATRGLENPSKAIKWDDWQVKVNTDAVPFPAELPTRRVSVNSFGYGGTNAHAIIEATECIAKGAAAPYTYVDSWTQKSQASGVRIRRTLERKRHFLLPFSAHDKVTVKRNISAHGKVAARYRLLDLSHTLGCRRSLLPSRAFTVASYSTLSNVFENVNENFVFADKKTIRSVVFVFTGQGAQWARMGADLMTYCPSFLQSIRALDHVLEELDGGPSWLIEDILLEGVESSPINTAEYSQPLCTAVQIALVQLLQSWGIRPIATVGHSSGEIAAGYAAGLISADDAIIAAYFRGIVSRDVNTQGAMLAVGLGADAIQPYLADLEAKVVVACDNSPALVTLSGDDVAIQAVQAKLDAAGVFNRAVKTGGKAYHSHHMAAVSEKYKHLVEKAKEGRKQRPRLDTAAKMVSSVTNSVLPQGNVLDADYWSTNLRSPVLFRQAVETLLTSEEFSEVDLFLEIGPHSAMAGPVKQIVQGLKGKEKTEYVATLLRNEQCSVRLLKVAGELFLRSYENLDMEKVAHAYVDDQLASSANGKRVSQKGCIIVDLPPYQWNYTRSLWAESRTSREHRQAKFPRHDVLGQLVLGNSLAEPTWRNMLRVSDLPWLKDHHLGGENVFPAAGYFAMAIEAIRQINEVSDKPVPIETFVLRDISIKTALVIPGDDNGIEVLLNMRPSIYGHAEWDWRVSSVETTGIQKDHMSGSIRINSHACDRTPRPIPHFPQRASGKAWNQALRDVGFDYGATFQDMDNIRFDGKNYHAACDTNIKQIVDPSLGESRYVLHPASIDSTLQLCIAAIYAGRTQAMDCGVVPVQVDEVTIWPPTKQQLDTQKATAYAHVHKRGLRTSESTIQMMSAENGEMVMEITNLRATAYEAAVPPKAESALADAPYGKMTWDLDIDIMENRQGLTAADLVNLALFKHPNFKVVELGFKNAASVLSRNPEAQWTIIVTSDEEDEAAQLIVAEYHNTKVVKLDLKQELESQGLTAASTDILIAHAEEPSLLSSLGFLLKPGARLINSELIISTKVTNETPIKERAVQLIYHKTQLPIISKIKIVLQEKFGWDVTVTKLINSLSSSIAEHTIMLADLEAPLLFNLKEDEFLAIQNIIAKTSSLLWVSTGAILSGKRPEYAMVSGLARSITSEQASIDFRVIDIYTDTVKPDSIAQSIANVARLQSDKSEELPEREFCIANGKTYISRLVRNHDLNKLYSSSAPVSTNFTPGDRITGLIIKNKVVFQQQEQTKSIKPGYVEVQVQSSGLTKEGVLTITGSDYATTFSHEIGGIVTRIGSGVSSFEAGDRVVGFNFGHFESYQEVPVALLRKLSASDDVIKTTTSNLIAAATALYGLVNLAAVRAGENVLVLNKTGFAGAAAIQIAQQKGANVYTVVETDDEVKFLIEQLGLDNSHIIKASDGLLSESFEAISDGHGADIVFSAGGSVDQHHAHEAWRCIAPFGRFLDSGRKGTLVGLVIDGLPINKSASYLPFDILEIGKSRPEVLSHLLPTIVDMSSAAASSNVKTINLGELDTAVSAFSDSFGAVKSVAQYQTSATSIQFLPPGASKLHFSPDATYLLVGCLGGLGRSLTSWMMEAGARRFTFLSRSGADAASAAECVRDLETAGAFVQVVRGDATSRADVVRAVKGVSSQNPIKGVVHAAMVLRDGLFHSMTYSSWQQSTQPKVLGAQNLHSVLADAHLDFFIMTSSISSILGTPGQSNYAAANAYLDSLARNRLARDSTATSIVLPMVLGVGVVAENSELEDALKRKGMYGIDEEHLLQAFEAGINAKTLDQIPDHVVVGLDPAKLQQAVSNSSVTDSFWIEDARFSHVVHSIYSSADDAAAGAQKSILASIKSAESPAEAILLINHHFVDKLARMLMLNVEDVDPEVGSISSYGIDSMIGAELRNWIFKEFAFDMPFQQLLAPTLTITKFAERVCIVKGIIEEGA